MENYKTKIAVVVTLLVLLAGFGVQVTYYHPFLSDDALISLRYAERFVSGDGLTWTDGERVEGYTDLLWVLIQAALFWLGFDAISAARGTGIAGALLAILGLCVPLHPGWRGTLSRALTGGALFALSVPLAVWAIGGLEHGFMTGILVAAMWWQLRGQQRQGRSRDRALLVAGMFYAALALLRADGALFAGVGGLVCLGFSLGRGPIRSFVVLVGPAAIAWSGQLGFRLAYYGEWVPNTARAKVHFSSHRVLVGAAHVGKGLMASGVLLIMAVFLTALAFWASARWRNQSGEATGDHARWVLPWGLFLAWTAYLIAVGGDIFPAWRQLLLGLPPLAFVVANAAEELVRHRRMHGLIVLPLMLVMAGHVAVQAYDSENKRAKIERWEWAGIPIGDLMRRAFGAKQPQPLLAVDAAGALPYWSKLPSLDMLGMTDAFIAKNPPADFGRGGIGHELGDGEYVWRRAPDIVAFNNANGVAKPHFRSGRELVAHGDFPERYGLVHVFGQVGSRQAFGALYIRKDGVLGLRREADRVVIPGYFLSSTPSLQAVLNSDDQLISVMKPRYIAQVQRIKLEPGRWRLQTSPAHGALRIGIRCDGVSAQPQSTGQPDVLETVVTMGIDIALGLRRDSAPSPVEEIRLERTEAAPGARCERPVQPLQFTYEELRRKPVPPGSRWDAPQYVTLSQFGMVVRFDELRHPAGIEISGDNNDLYVLRLLRHGEFIGALKALPMKQTGMATRHVAVPAALRTQGFDSVVILPRGGDGAFSIGHMQLRE